MSEETDADLEDQMIEYWLHPDHCGPDCRHCREEAEDAKT